ncbi:hypothetical protein [uncultured Shimia sp.]|uniref:hypothetical protein n=1 Tax=uncultured Shimia sp. TaxID=573152 RepID=UPI002635A858|nr:hypothetical protein [uncultured Shimia sp.]
MTRYTKTLSALTVVTAATYALLVGVGMAHLVLGPEKLQPFDLRPLGYSVQDAAQYLSLLNEDKAALYTGLLRRVDTLFPVLFGLWMGWVCWGLTRTLHPWSRVILLVAPASYTVMDLCENALVADMVLAFKTPPNPTLVSLASSYTVSKFVTLFVAFGLLLVMMIRKIGQSRLD